ncbi:MULTISPECIES: hypothetical protein [Streptomyces]|uniref:Uncharacterized protein n=1 Tax=Streptomyces eurythermus TaxID=42237 RepID=A0ABW6Z5F3_9ACTN|nr:hypothetical protein HB370_04990 [Streptomyces sp. DSM 40868]
MTRYTSAVDAVRAAYLRNRHTFYRCEQWWPDQPFWHRRHTGPTVLR